MSMRPIQGIETWLTHTCMAYIYGIWYIRTIKGSTHKDIKQVALDLISISVWSSASVSVSQVKLRPKGKQQNIPVLAFLGKFLNFQICPKNAGAPGQVMSLGSLRLICPQCTFVNSYRERYRTFA